MWCSEVRQEAKEAQVVAEQFWATTVTQKTVRRFWSSISQPKQRTQYHAKWQPAEWLIRNAALDRENSCHCLSALYQGKAKLVGGQRITLDAKKERDWCTRQRSQRGESELLAIARIG
jgi:hypothetical protein